MSTMELREYIDQELQANPVLEECRRMDEYDLDNAVTEEYDEPAVHVELYDNSELDSYERYNYRENNRTDADSISIAERYMKHEDSLNDHLMGQLNTSKAEPGVARIGEYIINSLGADGYLRSTWDEITEDCSGCSSEDIELAIELVQSFDPAGVCARSIEECLILQLARYGELNEIYSSIINRHLEDIANNRIQAIASDLGISRKDAQTACDRVRRLEPKPGNRFSDKQAINYVIPDVIVEWNGSNCESQINSGIVPDLEINGEYLTMAESADTDSKARDYLKNKVNEARNLMVGINKRNDTLVRITQAIIEYQDEFFKPESRLLKPLTMQKMAEDLGCHVSTVSRAIDGKYMQCNGKIYALRYFFGSGLTAASGVPGVGDGTRGSFDGEISVNTVKERIREIVGGEDKSKPMSDQKITEMLAGEGIDISRRTVAKYREGIGIPSTSKRKRY